MFRFACLALAVAWIAAAGSAQAQEKKNPIVEFDTSKGKIVVELFADKAPITVENILKYVDDKHYDGCIFHRVIADFMIQGGGMDEDMREKRTRDTIKNESSNGLLNKRGTLAMARTNAPDSASSQFFINVKDNAFLDKVNARDQVGYAVFGKVIDDESMKVVDAIRQVPTTTRGGHGDVPETAVVIRTARRK